MNILVLGSEGFLGSHLVRYLKEKRYQVSQADIVIQESERYYLINPEIPDYSFIFANESFDACINATGAANVQLSFRHPSLDFSLNSFNVYNILTAIKDHCPECKFINLSSAAVYGNPKALPINESHQIAPLSPYGFHKWYSELICRQFHELFSVPTLSIRIFSAYGEGLRKQLFWDVSKKIQQAMSDGTRLVTLFGSGAESRDFIHARDVCAAIDCVLQHAPFRGDVVNVASGDEVTIKEAVDLFVQRLGAHVTINFGGKIKTGDPLNWRADISRLMEMGYEPRISLDDGLSKVAKWILEEA